MVLSFLYKENPFYRFAEYTVIGAATGYWTVMAAKNIVDAGITPLVAGSYVLLIPAIFSVLMFSRYTKRYAWLSRYSVALMVGIGIGLSVRTYIHAQFTEQIVATMLPVVGVPWYTAINNLISIIIVVSTVLFFIFTREPKGGFKVITQIGRIGMMFFFGATFGTTVTTRMIYLIGRLQFLLFEWLKLSG